MEAVHHNPHAQKWHSTWFGLLSAAWPQLKYLHNHGQLDWRPAHGIPHSSKFADTGTEEFAQKKSCLKFKNDCLDAVTTAANAENSMVVENLDMAKAHCKMISRTKFRGIKYSVISRLTSWLSSRNQAIKKCSPHSESANNRADQGSVLNSRLLSTNYR